MAVAVGCGRSGAVLLPHFSAARADPLAAAGSSERLAHDMDEGFNRVRDTVRVSGLPRSKQYGSVVGSRKSNKLDPTLFVSPIISAAVALVQQRLDEAKAKDRNDVGRLVAYLRAVSDAVKGLEAEADELLSQCRWADWTDAQWRQRFLSRCGSYLDVDRLRPQLSQALQGLDASRSNLRGRADAVIQRSAKKAQRQAVMQDVENTLHKYDLYLESLKLGLKASAVPGAANILNSARHEIAAVTTAEEAQAAKERLVAGIEHSYDDRIGYQAAGVLEVLAVRIEDAFL